MFLVKITEFKNLLRIKRSNVVMRQHNVRYVFVRSVWRGMLDSFTLIFVLVDVVGE